MRAFTRPVPRATEIELLLLPSLITVVGLLTILLVPRGRLEWSWGELRVSLMFIGVVAATSVALSLFGVKGDQVLVPLTAMLSGLGLLMIQRLRPALEERGPGYATLPDKHVLFLFGGFAILWASAVFFRRHLDLLRRYKYTALLLSLGIMVATFIFGEEINGARLWIQVGPIQAQPSELAKISLVVFLAGYLDEKRDLIGSTWRLGFLRLPPIPYLLPMALMWVASLMVLVVQNDLGSALLFFGIFMAMLYVASNRVVYVVVGLVAFAAGSVLAYQLFDRIGVRVQNWLDPWQDPLVGGLQQIQSEYAIASGGVLGSGLGRGQPWYIPEVHTDFVFSAIAEELGLLGAMAVIVITFLLVMRGFMIGLVAGDGFARLLAVGLATTLGVQTLIILGGVLRIIPLTGITLPFISYGGSSLLTNFLLVGLLLASSAAPKGNGR
ncbi:MAG: FtsW/RodA/SpoVE family cell cycle protein [Thermomicrobiales bacterium]